MQIEEGAILNGKVTGLTAFGAFVELEGGKTGMVHISEVSKSFVNDIKDFLTIGQEVRVMVVGISDQGKISLSCKKVESEDSESDAVQQQEETPRKRPERHTPNVWNGQKPSAKAGEKQSFEDMMAHFKQVSDEKMTDLKRAGESKHGGGYSRRGGNK